VFFQATRRICRLGLADVIRGNNYIGTFGIRIVNFWFFVFLRIFGCYMFGFSVPSAKFTTVSECLED